MTAAAARPMTSREIGLALVALLKPIMGAGTRRAQMFRVYNGEEPPLAGISDHVTVTWASVWTEASEFDALNAERSIMLSIDAPEWGQARIARDAIGRVPVSRVTVRSFKGRSQRSFRKRTGTPEQVIQYVARWFYDHAKTSEDDRRLAERRANEMGFSLRGKR